MRIRCGSRWGRYVLFTNILDSLTAPCLVYNTASAANMASAWFIHWPLQPVHGLYGHKTEKNYKCGPIPNVIAALPNIGGILCKSLVIPFFVPCRKLWLMPTARVPCSNADNKGERKTWMKSRFSAGKIPLGARYQRRRRPNIVQSLVDGAC